MTTYDRTEFCSRKSLRFDFMDLLFAPNNQLMHTANAPWTEIEKDAVVGLRLMRLFEAFTSYSKQVSTQDQVIVSADADLIAQVSRLMRKLGCVKMLHDLTRIYVFLQKLSAHAAWPLMSERKADLFYRLKIAALNSGSQFDLKLATYLDENAAQLRGTEYSRQNFNYPVVPKAHQVNPLGIVRDWQAGNCYQLVFKHLDRTSPDDWQEQPDVIGFRENGTRVVNSKIDSHRNRLIHLGRAKGPGILQCLNPDDLDSVGEQTQWALLRMGFIFPRLLCNSLETFEQLRAQALANGAEILTQHLRLASHSSARNAFFCWEEEGIGQPALFAARFEGELPWLLLEVDERGWWFLEASANWQSHVVFGEYVFCKAKTEAALLAAFSHVSHDDNICYGAVSGSFPANRLLELLSDRWGVEKVLYRGHLAAWAFGHQWGGGSDEHSSVFCAQDAALSAQVAHHSVEAGLKVTWL